MIPEANRATTARVITVSLIAFMSTSIPRSGPPVTVVRVASRGLTCATHVFQEVDERQIALDALGPNPSTVIVEPVRAARAKKYDAAEASGSIA